MFTVHWTDVLNKVCCISYLVITTFKISRIIFLLPNIVIGISPKNPMLVGPYFDDVLIYFIICSDIPFLLINTSSSIDSEKFDSCYCFPSLDEVEAENSSCCENVTDGVCFVSVSAWCSVKRWTMLRGRGRSRCRLRIFWTNWWEEHLDMTPG